jgi:Protein of unknown function (DUF2550)
VSDELVLALAQITLVLIAVAAACVVLRRRVITRRGGIVECCLRSHASGRWHHGLAEYRSSELYWHRSLSLRLRPRAAFDRHGLAVTGSRPAGPGEAGWLGPGTMIVTCQARVPSMPTEHRGQRAAAEAIELAMSDGALTGYLAWLEGAPASYLGDAS